jgi:hypothetical protein
LDVEKKKTAIESAEVDMKKELEEELDDLVVYHTFAER